MIYELVKGISKLTTSSKKILPDIIQLNFTIVNAFMVSDDDRNGWVLVDAGLENSYEFIRKTSEEQFGKDCRPKSILLTHGHFDHVGSVMRLADYWGVKVYAHALEIPYLTGQKDYPEGDPSVDEGLVAKMSPYFPNKGIDLGNRVSELKSDGTIPCLPGWEWIHTPGHTEGHVSFFRKSDRTLIVGDAFTTRKQESLLSVLNEDEDVKGPPAYLTTDWTTAERSVEVLDNLRPVIALPSHGAVLRGDELTRHLQLLKEHFKEEAVPDEGRFVKK